MLRMAARNAMAAHPQDKDAEERYKNAERDGDISETVWRFG